MAKSNMNNLDSMSISKLPYNISQPSGGYSHNTQMYTLLNKNLKFILSFKKKRISFRFFKIKKLRKPMVSHIKVKKKRFFKSNFQVRRTTLTFINVNRNHLMTYTTLYPKPYLFKISQIEGVKIHKKVTFYKNFSKIKKLWHYKKSILMKYNDEFLNYSMRRFELRHVVMGRTFEEKNILSNTNWLYLDGIKKQSQSLVYMKYDHNMQRLDKQKWHSMLYIFLMYISFFPNNTTVPERNTFEVLKWKYIYPYKYYRFFMGFPLNGQRTWSNAKTSKKRVNFVKNWEADITARQFKFTCPKVVLLKLTHMEFINDLWFHQWRHEWFYARNYRYYFEEKWKYKTWKFGLDFAVKNRALTYYNSPYKLKPKKKKKRNKRKVVLPKNTINIGLDKGFAKVFFKKIFHKTIWMRKRQVLL